MGILVACQASAQIAMPVAFKKVLKSRVSKIQSHIDQFFDSEPISFECHHYPVHTGDSRKTVMFVWASERETHAIQSCLYQEIKTAEDIVALVLLHSFGFTEARWTMKFCNRSMNATAKIIPLHKVIISNFYFNDSENDGLIVEESSVWYEKSDIPTASSLIDVRPLKNTDTEVRTFVCSSLELTPDKTGKLRQQFFSVIGNFTETVIESTLNDSAGITLEFDVLALSDLVNDSNIKHMILSHMHMWCVKLDPYGLSNETNEIEIMNTTDELVLTTKTVIVNDKLRVYVNVAIPVVSDHSFGKYSCSTYCELRTKNSNSDVIHGCMQRKYFTVISHDWRVENLSFRIALKLCKNALMNFNETFSLRIAKITNSTEKFKETANRCLKSLNQTTNYFEKAMLQLEEMTLQSVIVWNIFTHALKYTITTIDSLETEKKFLGFVLIVIMVVMVVIVLRKITEEIQTRSNLKSFISTTSVLQSTENIINRAMKYDVFLSYSSKDRPWVESTLLKFIESKGFTVCFDERDFPFGCNLVETISTAVCESRKVIAVVSPNYLESRWCVQLEYLLTYTRILNKEASSNSFLLIKYKDCNMPEHMRIHKYLDYTTTTTALDDNRSVVMKLFSYVSSLYKKVEVREIPAEQKFFDDLFSWLRKPRNATHPEHHGRQKHTNRKHR